MGFESDIAAKEFFGKGRRRKEERKMEIGIADWQTKLINSTVSEPVLVQKRKEKKRTARKETKKEGRSVGG